MERGEHPAKLKRLGRHKSFDVLGDTWNSGICSRDTRSTACCSRSPGTVVKEGCGRSDAIPASARIDLEGLVATIGTAKPSDNHVALGRALASR